MSHDGCIIQACTINGDGSGKKLKGDAVAKALKAKSLAWVHLDAAHPDTRQWLQENVSYLDYIRCTFG